MKEFTALYQALDETTKTKQKILAMRDYFAACPNADAAWAVYFLSGRRLKRLLPTSLFRQTCVEAADVGGWMLEECYDAVGDLAETVALLLPHQDRPSTGSLTHWVEQRLQPLATYDDDARRVALKQAWDELPTGERFVFNKLVTGAFRVGVSQRLVVRALAELSGLDPALITHRLMGNWSPTAESYNALVGPDTGEVDHSRPYPFCLAHALQDDPRTLGAADDWIAEWKWDGIRGQIIRRQGEFFLWSRGEELIHDRFPELQPAMQQLPDGVVLDGEVVGWKDGQVLPFSELQRRIGRKTVSKKMLEEVPVRFMAFDLLDYEANDMRQLPLVARRARLEEMLSDRPENFGIMASPRIQRFTWDELAKVRASSREHHVEGLMLKGAKSPYGVGRTRGLWWKWKVDPYTCDAVMVYAQRGSGRRASLYTDYTFAVWNNDQLVPFAKAYSGLTDEEIREVDRFVRQNTLERFGPVRAVRPELVFEIAFENIQLSKRHKSGVAVRFPRILRRRHDKRPQDADTLQRLKALMRCVSKAKER